MLNKLLALPLLAAVAAVTPFATEAQQISPDIPLRPEWYGPGPWHMWGGGYGFWWGPFFMMVVMALVIGCVVYFMTRGHGPVDRHRTHSALEILNERFAMGEIEKEEYEARRATILGRG